MSRQDSRGCGRAAVSGKSTPGWMTTGQLLTHLQLEGLPVTRRIVDHAVANGLVPRPAKVGNWRRWTRAHADAVRAYMRDYSRAAAKAGGDA